MFRKILAGLVVGLFLMTGVCRSEGQGNGQKLIQEIKSWNYSLGDFCYLVKEGQSYYGISISKDIGQ